MGTDPSGRRVTGMGETEIERELTARVAYVESIRLHGGLHFMRHDRSVGWSVRDWRGEQVGIQIRRRRDAEMFVRGLVEECSVRITELRAQLVAAAYDADLAAVSPEERLAGARAQQAAYDGPRWRRTA